MQFNRPIAMSIAGMDPCGGAGLLADVKTFEQHKVYGLGVSTAQTLQTENEFLSIRWEEEVNVIQAVHHMLESYEVSAAKIGIVESIEALYNIVSAIHSSNPDIKIIVDPVIRSTTEFNFWSKGVDESLFEELLRKITLITPNYKEVVQLTNNINAKQAAQRLSEYCAVLLKGGHNDEEQGVDYLYITGAVKRLDPDVVTVFPKHGSGCVLSAAIASNLALGLHLTTACIKAKAFTEKFLISNPSLLGYHVS